MNSHPNVSNDRLLTLFDLSADIRKGLRSLATKNAGNGGTADSLRDVIRQDHVLLDALRTECGQDTPEMVRLVNVAHADGVVHVAKMERARQDYLAKYDDLPWPASYKRATSVRAVIGSLTSAATQAGTKCDPMEGFTVTHSIRQIAKDAGISASSVQGAIKWMLENGWLNAVESTSAAMRGYANGYQVVSPWVLEQRDSVTLPRNEYMDPTNVLHNTPHSHTVTESVTDLFCGRDQYMYVLDGGQQVEGGLPSASVGSHPLWTHEGLGESGRRVCVALEQAHEGLTAPDLYKPGEHCVASRGTVMAKLHALAWHGLVELRDGRWVRTGLALDDAQGIGDLVAVVSAKSDRISAALTREQENYRTQVLGRGSCSTAVNPTAGTVRPSEEPCRTGVEPTAQPRMSDQGRTIAP